MKESENFYNAKQVFQKGDFLGAFDLAQKDLEKDPKNHDILYLATLCLARSGATDQAISSLNNYKFQIPNTEDFLALRARLYKDKFLTEKNTS
jgi:thioredoxin-like negative regulator of GroEL